MISPKMISPHDRRPKTPCRVDNCSGVAFSCCYRGGQVHSKPNHNTGDWAHHDLAQFLWAMVVKGHPYREEEYKSVNDFGPKSLGRLYPDWGGPMWVRIGHCKCASSQWVTARNGSFDHGLKGPGSEDSSNTLGHDVDHGPRKGDEAHESGRDGDGGVDVATRDGVGSKAKNCYNESNKTSKYNVGCLSIYFGGYENCI